MKQSRSIRKQSYLNYLDSAHWRALRHAAFERDGYRCQGCGTSKKLRGHHVRYRKNLEHCTVDDIQTLCEACHKRHHRKQRRARKKMRHERSVRHLAHLILFFDADP